MKLDRNLLQYSLFIAATAILIYLGITTVNHLGDIFSFLYRTLDKTFDLAKPLLIALVIAYLLKPGVHGIEKFLAGKGLLKHPAARRAVGIALMYLLVITVFFAVIYGIYIMIGGKLSNKTTIDNITAYLNEYLRNSTLTVNAISNKLESLNIPLPGNINEKIAQIVTTVQEYFATLIANATQYLAALISNIASFLIAAVFSVYLIKDAEYFADLWNKLFSLLLGKSETGVKIREILGIFDDTFKKFIRGQFLEAAIVGALSAVVLYLIGIDYALVIGVISGICNMIPYIGPIAGTVLAVIMALLGGQPITALWAVAGMIAVQQVDNNLLAPKIVGASVGLHPIFIVLAILIGGNVGGLVGMLTAVPVAASLKILFGKWYAAHQEKPSA